MSMLHSQVGRARRRLMANVLMDSAAVGVLAAAATWAVILLIERLFAVGISLAATVIGAGALALVVTLAGLLLRRVRPLEAAVVLDGAAALKERLSTALTVERSADPFARAAVQDAERAAGRVHVPACLPLKSPKLLPWSLATVTTAALLWLFMPQFDLLAGSKPKEDPAAKRAAEVERKNITQAVNQQLNKVKELAKESPELAELAKELPKLDLPDRATLTPEDVRREALKRIDSVTEKLEQQKSAEKFGSLDEVKRMLSKIEQKQGKSTADKLQNSLSQGDMQSARKALEEMKQQLQEAAKSGDAEAQKKAAELAKQLEALSKELRKVADRTQVEKDLENKAGLTPEQARKLLDDIAKMDPKQIEKELQRQLGEKGMNPEQIRELAKKIAENQQALRQCEGLGQALAKCAQAMKNQGAETQDGQQGGQDSDGAMAEAMGMMSEMEMAEQMMNELQAQIGELKELREGVCKGNCPGQKPGDEIGGQGPNYGQGYGSRIGKEKTAHNLKPTKVKSPLHDGEIIGQMLFDGPQVKGESRLAVKDAVNSAVRDATDAIQREQVPRQYARAVKEYFDALAGLAGGAPQEQPKPEPAPADDR